MNIPEAHAALARPLRFADPEQITAMRFLADVAAAHKALLRCRRCKGDGVTFLRNKRETAQCTCIEHFAREVIEACGIEYRPAVERRPVAVER